MLATSTSISASRDALLVNAILQRNYSDYCNTLDMIQFLDEFFIDNKFMLEKLKMDASPTPLDNKNLRNILDYFNTCLKGTIPADTLNNLRTLNFEIRKVSDFSKINEDLPNLISSSIELSKNTIKSVSIPDNGVSLDNTITYEYLHTEILDLLNITKDLIIKCYKTNSCTITTEVQKKIITLIKDTQENLSPFEASNIKNIFASSYVHNHTSNINSMCKRIFNVTECTFYPLKPYRKMQAIIEHRLPDTHSAGEILEKLPSATHLITLSTTEHGNPPLSNFFSYFLSYITDLNNRDVAISKEFKNNLTLWITKLPPAFKKTAPEYIYDKLFSLVEEVLKNPKMDLPQLHAFTPAIDTCANLMEKLLRHHTDIDTSIELFSKIFLQINKLNISDSKLKLKFAKKLSELSLICHHQKDCPSIFILNQFSEVLNAMVRSVPLSDNITRTKLEKTAQQMLILSSINNTSATDRVKAHNVTHVTRDSDILASRNDSATPMKHHSYLPSALELGTSVAHGAGNGIINALSQHLYEYLNKRDYKGSKIKAISLSTVMTIAHSAYAASLPLMFASLHNKNPQDDEQTNITQEILIQQVMPTFTTNLVLSLGFQLLNALQKNYLKNFPILKNLVRSVPVLSTAYTIIQSPVSTAAHMVSAAGTSSALSALLNHRSSSTDRSAPLEISSPTPLVNSIDHSQEETSLLTESTDNGIETLSEIGEIGNTANGNKHYDVPRSTLSNNEGIEPEPTYLKMDKYINNNNACHNANTYDTPKNSRCIGESNSASENIYISIKNLQDQEVLERSQNNIYQNRPLPEIPTLGTNPSFFQLSTQSPLKEVSPRSTNTSRFSY